MDVDTPAEDRPQETPPRRGHRLWIPIGIALLAAAGWIAAQRRPDLDRNILAFLQVLIVLLAFVLGLLWFAFLSRFRWRTRLITLALLAVAGFAATRLVRVDGTTDGRGLPKLAWKWTAPPTPVLPQPAPAPQAATPPVDAPSTPPGVADVPQFFGPQRDGQIQGANLARDWTATPPTELWRQPIGAGWSAFAVVGSRAYTQEQRDTNECVTCYDLRSGRLLWLHAYPTRFEQWQAGVGPHATPTVHRDRVFAYGATGVLVCLDVATGERLWAREVLAENDLRNLEWGTSASPLVVDDLVIVTGGQSPGPTVLAYDRSTGEPRWKSGTDRASYASPRFATLAGRQVILSFNAATITAHDPASGRILLEHPWGLDKPPRAAQPVVLDGDRIFLTAGYGMGCELLQVGAAADGQITVTSVWKNIRMKAQFNSVAAREGHLYGLDDGLLACVTVAKGERRWKDGRYGSGQTLLVDDLLLVQAEQGDVALVEAKPYAFRELGRLPALSSKTWNHPTLAGRHLLVRNDREAVCYELPVAASAATGTPSP